MGFRLPIFLLCCGFAFSMGASPLEAQTLVWDHPEPATVTGYAVIVDGVRTDHGLRAAGPGGACGCSLPLPLPAGLHTIAVAAYNTGGETRSGTQTVEVAPTPPPPGPGTGTLPSPWLTQDIGSVGATGSASVNSAGTYAVSGAGADIWGTRDAFRFAHQSLSGNGTVVARVASMENTNTFAKAGIMMREGLGANTPHTLLNLRPNGVIEFLKRGAMDGSTQVVATTTSPAPVWLRLQRAGTTVTASTSRDGVSWATLASTTLNVGSPIDVGLVVCSHVTGMLNRATFDSVSVTPGTPGAPSPPPTPTPPPTTGPVPAPWTSQDVGSTNLTGSASFSNGTFTVTGAGDNVWGTADGFHYVSRPQTANGSITARVVRLDNTDTFAKAGIMLRGSLSRSAADVVLNVRPNGSVEFMSRPVSGAPTTFIASAGQTPPAWLRLTRAGTTVSADVSANGTSWTRIGTVNVSGMQLAGLFVTSRNLAVRNTAVFDSVTVSGSN
jgi:regulation of enolase protein 1 (concanavalin A-like superfamily)